MSKREAPLPKPGGSKAVKQAWAKSGRHSSLKQFARSLVSGAGVSRDQEIRVSAKDWFFNKTANFAKPPLGLGKTRRKKGKDGKSSVKLTSSAAAPTARGNR